MLKYLLITFLLIFIACEKQLDYTIPYTGDKLVVNAFIAPTIPLQVHVTKTKPPTGTFLYKDLLVTDAQVIVFEDNQAIDTLVYEGTNVYKSKKNTRPKEGKSYFLKVNAPNLPSIETEKDIVPKTPTILSYLLDQNMQVNIGSQQKNAVLKLTFKDEKDISNFYDLGLDIHLITDTILSGRLENIDVVTDQRDYCGFHRLLFDFTDVCFDGKEKQLNLLANIEEFAGKDIFQIELTKGDFFLFHFKSISPYYHQYYEHAIVYESIELAFTEPNFTYSNVKGGFGVFATYNETILKIPIK